MCCNKKSSQLCRYILSPTALAADALAFYLHHLDEDIERKLLKKSTLLLSICSNSTAKKESLSFTHHYYLNDKSVKDLLFFGHSLQVQCTSNFIVTKNVTLFLVSPSLLQYYYLTYLLTSLFLLTFFTRKIYHSFLGLRKSFVVVIDFGDK